MLASSRPPCEFPIPNLEEAPAHAARLKEKALEKARGESRAKQAALDETLEQLAAARAEAAKWRQTVATITARAREHAATSQGQLVGALRRLNWLTQQHRVRGRDARRGWCLAGEHLTSDT